MFEFPKGHKLDHISLGLPDPLTLIRVYERTLITIEHPDPFNVATAHSNNDNRDGVGAGLDDLVNGF